MTAEPIEFLIDGPGSGFSATIVLAHGAGAPMDSDFMNTVALGLADHSFRVVRFEFPYMVQRRNTGKSRPPNRSPVLEETWLEVIRQISDGPTFIGGKSMGGRIATMIADSVDVAGVVCLGYPFHPTGKPEVLRIEHLQDIRTGVLIVQGDRDPFGNQKEVAGYRLSNQVEIHWIPDGDHSFKPRKSSGYTLERNIDNAVNTVAQFVRMRSG